MTSKEEIMLLRKIGQLINAILSEQFTPLEITSDNLYGLLLIKKIKLYNLLSYKDLNRFLMQQHQQGILKQIIPNYKVDIADNQNYLWCFKNEKGKANLSANENLEANEKPFINKRPDKIHLVSNGVMVSSLQEKYIYEQLLRCNYLRIDYDFPLTRSGQTKHPDFIIRNTLTDTEFIWEHFGMTNNENYKDGMVRKIEWYKNNGFLPLEEGGNLIYTYYVSQANLTRDVLKYLPIITKINNG